MTALQRLAQELRSEGGILAGTAHVQLTDASSFICNASTGGIGAGGGVGGGAGKFTSS